MIMKPLVKTFHGYLAENLSPEEESELASMGFKTQLEEIDDISGAIEDRLSMDAEVRRLSAELELRLKTLCSEFKRDYEYSDELMSEASVQLDEWARDVKLATENGRILDVAVADAVYTHLVLQRNLR